MGSTKRAKTKALPQVAERAYEIWEGEGRPEGQALAHWLRAEAELADVPATPRPAQRTPRAKKEPAAPRKAATGTAKKTTKAGGARRTRTPSPDPGA